MIAPDDDFSAERLEAEVIALGDARDRRDAEKPRWHWARAAVPDIRAHSTDPRAPITLGGEVLVELEPGDIMTLVAASKRGKTSLALCALHEHARDRGPALGCSLELPARQLVAREIGARRDASWRDVLRGQISDADMYSAIPERLAVVDRDETEPLVAAGMAVAAMRVQHPNQPILVAVDYLQLLPADEQHEIRARVDAAMRHLSRWARDLAVMVLALSQSSRASSRALLSGERTGADAMDAGAESASIERWSSAIVTLGVQGEPDERGVAPVELSIAGQRMDRGDQVRAARYDGRTGLWTLVGEARSAAAAKAERETAREEQARAAAELAIVPLLEKSPTPMSATQIRAAIGGQRGVVCAAVRVLLERGEIVHYGCARGGIRPVWTPARVAAATGGTGADA